MPHPPQPPQALQYVCKPARPAHASEKRGIVPLLHSLIKNLRAHAMSGCVRVGGISGRVVERGMYRCGGAAVAAAAVAAAAAAAAAAAVVPPLQVRSR